MGEDDVLFFDFGQVHPVFCTCVSRMAQLGIHVAQLQSSVPMKVMWLHKTQLRLGSFFPQFSLV